jgi:ankyrin repeat protein
MHSTYFCFKTGLSALHIAAFYGNYEFCRVLIEQVSANLPSEEPNSRAIFEDVKLEVE